MPLHGPEVALEVRVAIATCRLLYHKTFESIERKTGVKATTVAYLMRRAIDRAGNKDFNDIIACLGNNDRPRAPARIEDQSDLSKSVR